MLKGGHSLLFVNAPKGYVQSIGSLPDGVRVLKTPAGRADVIQVFVTSLEEMKTDLNRDFIRG
jgi:hypothetical protein